MSETWQEYIDRHRNDPQERAGTERYLQDLGDTQPETSAYWRAILKGDENAARVLVIEEDIAELREKARHDPLSAELLASRIAEVKALEAAARTASPAAI